MLSQSYLTLLAKAYRKRHRLPGQPMEIPEARQLADLLDDRWLFARQSPKGRGRKATRGMSLHVLAVAEAEGEWCVRAPARLSALVQFSGVPQGKFPSQCASVEMGAPQFSRIVNAEDPFQLAMAQAVAERFDFDYQWFIWPKFNKGPHIGGLITWHQHPIDEIIAKAPAIISGKTLVTEAFPSIRVGRYPTWVHPFLIAEYAHQLKVAGPYRTTRLMPDIPRPDGIPDCNWTSIGPDFAHLDLKKKPAQADSSSTPSRKGHKASKRGS